MFVEEKKGKKKKEEKELSFEKKSSRFKFQFLTSKMSDLFLCEDAKKLLLNKFVVILGDSIQRSLYKDLVSLLNDSAYVKDDQLRTKGEIEFQGDELLNGGITNLNNGPGYRASK